MQKAENGEKDITCEFATDENNKTRFKTRYAPNKLLDTIIGKLSRKSGDKTMHNAPWFYYLIKDAMRMSMVFEEERDISA